jgi:NitT/TauT family transport system ATP-binding protein
MIRVQNLTFTYPEGVEALGDISFSVKKGESCAIIGPSGCGKTTLLYLIAGLLPIQTGAIQVNGTTTTRGNIPMILQDYGLFPWKTVWENVAMGLILKHLSHSEIKQRLEPILEELGLTPFTNFYPSQLSGGQRQRVAIARVLAMNPSLILMDEPFSSLDAMTREHLQRLLANIWKRHQITFIIVTHSIEEATFLGKKILVLTQRPARIRAEVENPHAGNLAYRSSKSFFETSSQLRKTLFATQEAQE